MADLELLGDAGRDPADVVGPAAVLSERALVKVGLQVLGADCASVGVR
jgi:hypothetical protein